MEHKKQRKMPAIAGEHSAGIEFQPTQIRLMNYCINFKSTTKI